MTDELSLAQKLLGVMHRLRHRMDADLRHIDKAHHVDPAHFPVLINLRRRAYNVSELAERLEVSLPSMSKTVTALVKRGWVERARLAEDRRVVQLHLTDDGKKMLQEMRIQAENAVAALLAPLSTEQREQLSVGLDTLYTALGEFLDRVPPAPPQASEQ
jgi:DNA-binding MarR family transcriptional regulator